MSERMCVRADGNARDSAAAERGRTKLCFMRVWCNGSTSAFQAENASSILAIRSTGLKECRVFVWLAYGHALPRGASTGQSTLQEMHMRKIIDMTSAGQIAAEFVSGVTVWTVEEFDEDGNVKKRTSFSDSAKAKSLWQRVRSKAPAGVAEKGAGA